jgi:hypothetical protein
MTQTYDDIHNRVLRLLNDADAATYGDELCYDGIVAAHDAILPWVPKQSITTVTAGSDGLLFALPADTYIVQAVQIESSGEFVPKANFAPRSIRRSDYLAQDWIEYPSRYVSLANSLSEGSKVNIYYLAYWDKPANAENGTFVLTVPPMAHQGLVYYAASHVLLPSAVNSASIRQFNQRIDSGTPEDNPLKTESKYLLERFMNEMKMMPPYAKVGQ